MNSSHLLCGDFAYKRIAFSLLFIGSCFLGIDHYSLAAGEPLTNDGIGNFSAGTIKSYPDLLHLQNLYDDLEKQCAIDLKKSIERHIDNHDFMSPLHVVIEAISLWKMDAVDIIDNLFKIVDYNVVWPAGISIPSEYMFPATKALIHINVNPIIALEYAIKHNGRKRRLCLWIYIQRIGEEDALALLSFYKGIDRIKLTDDVYEALSNIIPDILENGIIGNT